MSNRYKGGVISATPPTTTGGESGTASGAWTLEQQMQLQAAGLWPAQPTGPYIEQVFSTYLYTGTGATNNIVNGIDLAGKGGLVWTKARTTTSAFAFSHALIDTVRGAGIQLVSNGTSGNATQADSLTAFNSNGYTLGADTGQGRVNNTSYGTQTYVGWTFREQAKFFDIVSYTGTGTLRTIAHNLGSVPGCIIIKNLSDTDGWLVYHRSIGATQTLTLNSTSSAQADGNTYFNDTAPTSSVFTVNTGGKANQAGNNYVAYLFAHDAGGFGLTGTDNVISCGSYTGNGSTTGPVINLGYEPQWLMIKNASGANEWVILDNMRGIVTDGVDPRLFPNNSDAENTGDFQCKVSATGFQPESISAIVNTSGSTYIYIAIRRGPMRVPTVGTSVFLPALASSSGVYTVTTNFPVDLCWYGNRTNSDKWYDFDRLRGNPYLKLNTTAAEVASSGAFDSNVNFRFTGFTGDGSGYINYAFQRAPSFFDVVCYTGTGADLVVNHNLQAVPELIILKYRQGTSYGWKVTAAGLTNPNTYYLDLNGTNAESNYTANFIYNRTTTTFSVVVDLAQSGWNWVAYLFATCAGVSKVGSYTGTGAAQTINCGFTAGSRFVLIKRTDSTGDWYVWDSTRGIIPSNDPYLQLNNTNAEVTGTDYVDTTNVGFDITSTAPAAINANGGTFIFLAIA